MTWVKMEEDDDIYIDCKPTNELNRVEQSSSSQGVSNMVLGDMENEINSGMIIDNVGFQTFLGITLMAVIYGIGDYVFKTLPKEYIEKKRFNM